MTKVMITGTQLADRLVLLEGEEDEETQEANHEDKVNSAT